MATLTVNLKQHTPMWHFQWDHPGCTLRATELKPKLDKFLIAKMKEKGGSIPDDYWTDPQKKGEKDFYALDYKVSIIPSVESSGTLVGFQNAKFSLFFANMGEENESQKVPIYYKASLQCRFFSLNEEIINLIRENINAFFASTNFGTRQSKGFGSFLPEEVNDLQGLGTSYKFSIEIERQIRKKNRDGSFSVIEVQPLSVQYFQQLFQQLETFYKVLRSGNAIQKQGSLMEAYAKGQKKVWDKDLFKTLLPSYRGGISTKEHYLFRDLLGLSPSIEYKLGRDRGCKIEKSSKDIERFKSPLTFKPVETSEFHFDVYLFLSDVPDEMRKATFTATSSSNRRTVGSMDLQLCPGLNLHDYMKFVYDNRKTVNQKAAKKMFNSLEKL